MGGSMVSAELKRALNGLAQGHALSADELAALRAALAAEPAAGGLPLDELFLDDVAGDAALVLALVDEEPQASGWIGRALAAEAGAGPDVADGVLAALFASDPGAVPVVEAVTEAAGAAPELAAGFDPVALPVSQAVSAGAGVAPELAAGFDPGAIPVSEAVRAAVVEAGGIPDVAAGVLAALGVGHDAEEVPEEALLSALLDGALDGALRDRATALLFQRPAARAQLTQLATLGRVLREAVRGEAAAQPAVQPAVWTSVAGDIGLADPEAVPGWSPGWLGPAVRAEAGQIDIVASVMRAVDADVRPAAGRRDAVADGFELPVPANTAAWHVQTVVLLAAAVALFVLVPRLFGAPPEEGLSLQPLEYAAMGEVGVTEVTVDWATVYVEQPDADAKPLTIWVTEGDAL